MDGVGQAVCVSEDAFFHVHFYEAEPGGKVCHGACNADVGDFFVQHCLVFQRREVLDVVVFVEQVDITVVVDNEQFVCFVAVCDVCDASIAQYVHVVVGAYLAVFGVVGEQVPVHEGVDGAASYFAFGGDVVTEVQPPGA